ncbi:hypothetical protein DICVIV_03789 [Dictyocaulus viviparus]|uniref:Uncharacterized protein n=1 Tax=Dictyocaulus viviparus TaxID=29172 RepID=A0A0D8XZH7_DICVI|nr:hypothetical protein DICVIV_03789 [Dictyocaulus viviparus]
MEPRTGRRRDSHDEQSADLLLLSTSEPHGICYIETMELDGETNLKTRCATPDTAEMGDDLDAISGFNGEIICEAPNNRLNKFQGKLIWQGRELPITNENILLRGCILKNTRWWFYYPYRTVSDCDVFDLYGIMWGVGMDNWSMVYRLSPMG